MPKDFPDKYRAAIINTMELWVVKKHLQKPPTFEITTSYMYKFLQAKNINREGCTERLKNCVLGGYFLNTD